MIDRSSLLVTGGCGFIGVNLARALATRDCSLIAFDDLSTSSRADADEAGYEVVEGDIRDRHALSAVMRDVEMVVHLAAHTNVIESVADPRSDVETNVIGTLNVLEEARSAGVRRVVFASSNAPLGEIDPPTHEERVPRPVSPYGASKLAGEGLCSAFSGSYGLPAISLRFSNVYGPFSYHKGSVVATFMRNVMEDQPLIVFGDGEQTRDFIYVEDLVEGIVQALESPVPDRLLHLGTGRETSINRLIDIFRRCFADKEIRVERRPARSGEIVRNYSDVSRAKAALGFSPRTDIQEGVRLTRLWFESAGVS